MVAVTLRLADIPPGTMQSVDLGGEEIVVANVGGRCYAIGGICTHDGAPLADGTLDGAKLTCPWHGTEFDVRTGKVIEGLTDEPVPVYEVRVDGGSIQVIKP